MLVILLYNLWLYMFEEEMKVGPKGQVVIPQAMRKALKIEPGSKVLFKLEDDKMILKKPSFDAVSFFQRVAKSGRSVSKINPHAYEEELEERTRRALSGC
jgi:AbrB family looped-hinge helix DNA binding protein